MSGVDDTVAARLQLETPDTPDTAPATPGRTLRETLQQQRTDAERPAMRASRLTGTESLALWKDVTVAAVAGDMPDLSARQMAVLLCVYLEDGPHTVRSLAARLDVTKAVISRAIDRLKSFDYIKRADDPRDRRSIVLRRTPGGIAYLRHFAGLIHDQWPDGRRGR